MSTTFKLNTGAQIPAVGFGTWQDAEAQEQAVLEAIKAGYRHIDTARIYGTEEAVGKAIKKSGVPRDQLFITTKLWNNKHHPDDVAQALQDSLNDLDLDYVDLFLMHWPVAFKRGTEKFPKNESGKPAVDDIDYVDTYKAMEKLLSTGKVKAIGVSNFSKAEMEHLLKETSVVPAVHQLESHPWLQQRSFADWHKSKGIHVTHYSPFGNQNELYSREGTIGKLIDDPVLVEIGKKYNKSSAQVALAWGINEGHSVLPKSKTPSRIKDNLQGDFKLDAEDLQKIRGIDRKLRFNDSSADFGREFFGDLDGKQK
ncbi:NADP-dependent oxidoreductase domain-containing protein [Aspergillus welwitschiae]|uniref:D-xylose reductase [NAD(P)H] n=1 Tax=Aspergillus welwitschiae TaxID=1341132 RepID=A0A3F3PQV6_9EURO|nr:NADP-dependent oxidoreductase domain-containing protein [Aspergillus welwitschiae]RDH29327.1 NADP-dependent oxidoreductase domain-containing protein [Aspergillus welwitschiae]